MTPPANLAKTFAQQLKKLPKQKASAADVSALKKNLTALQALDGDALTSTLHAAVQELCGESAKKINGELIPYAKQELDAIVKATEAASNAIMEAAEAIQAASQKAPADVGKAVGAGVSKVFEGCTFQDITGQRVTNVSKTLTDIAQVLGGGVATSVQPSKPVKKTATGAIDEASLMNGPQLNQPSQDDIDKLFDSQ